MRIEALAQPPALGMLHLEPLGEPHREGLRAACAEDPAIWEIYPVSYDPSRFDASFAALLANPTRLPFAVFDGELLAGMSAYLNPDPARRIVEIGSTFLRPAVRGSGLNARLKRLMIEHAFACGVHRIEFRIDERNARSKAAVAKIGGVYEGTMRQERVTWNGHLRDTALFSILQGEWH